MINVIINNNVLHVYMYMHELFTCQVIDSKGACTMLTDSIKMALFSVSTLSPMIVAHAMFKNVHNLCISNLPCILLFSYLLKKTFHLNVQAIIINLRDWFSNVSLSIV